ncbi:DUF2273 domain-containing protein [Paenibacillus sp. CAU 1782]
MWREFWNAYWRRLTGVAAGIGLSIVYLAFGFWDMLFVALIVFTCYWYAKRKETSNEPVIPWQRLWDGIMERFRPFR